MRRLGAELIGTFILVFVATGVIVISAKQGGAVSHEGIAAATGLVVLIMVYTTGHISGAHLNPAVTLAFSAVRHFPAAEVLPYFGAQVAGGLAASALLRAMFGNVASLGATIPAGTDAQALVLELVLAFILMFVIMAVATDTRAVGQAAAIAIGGTIGLEVMFAGPISSASMNPVRSLAPALVSDRLSDVWIYLIAPPIGALVGAAAYQLIRGEPA